MASEPERAQLENRGASHLELWPRKDPSTVPPDPSSLEGDVRKGDNPVESGECLSTMTYRRVGLFGNAAQIGW